MTITRKFIPSLLAALLASLFGLGLLAPTSPVAAGEIGGLTTCVDLDENGFPQCDHPDDEDEEEEVPEEEPPPPADPGGEIVVAEPTFTG